MGHILTKDKRLPYLHEQFFILNLKRWDHAGRPEFGQPYVWHPRLASNYRTSGENVHDGDGFELPIPVNLDWY
jgi:hypothetical protein